MMCKTINFVRTTIVIVPHFKSLTQPVLFIHRISLMPLIETRHRVGNDSSRQVGCRDPLHHHKSRAFITFLHLAYISRLSRECHVTHLPVRAATERCIPCSSDGHGKFAILDCVLSRRTLSPAGLFPDDARAMMLVPFLGLLM